MAKRVKRDGDVDATKESRINRVIRDQAEHLRRCYASAKDDFLATFRYNAATSSRYDVDGSEHITFYVMSFHNARADTAAILDSIDNLKNAGYTVACISDGQMGSDIFKYTISVGNLLDPSAYK